MLVSSVSAPYVGVAQRVGSLWLGCIRPHLGMSGWGQSGAPEADSQPMSNAGHGDTHSSAFKAASPGGLVRRLVTIQAEMERWWAVSN